MNFITKIYFMIMVIASVFAFILGIYFLLLDAMIFFEYEIAVTSSVSIVMTILLDWKSLLFCSFVFYISSVVVLFSDEYMGSELELGRFVLLIVLFVVSMVFLIISPNMISILLGWDGLGLVSYCLVIYFQNVKSSAAGMLTALSNRVGDVALLMSIAWLFNYGSWSYVLYVEFMGGDFIMQLISWLILLASMTKSAQIPFSAWLPAAMAAPTPVSALVHSSTLVTAGVYLLIRFSPVFSDLLNKTLFFVGLMTMFMAGLGANFEYDLKKIIALSTLSQLGFMLSVLSMGGADLAFFHLLMHALFKALLFMCAGSIIHSLLNFQDIRFMGGLFGQLPLTCTYFNICNLSLCGIPFMTGFYSKDLIIETLSMSGLNVFSYFVFYLSLGLTVCYSFRLSYYLFVGDFNFMVVHMANDPKFSMLKGMGLMITTVIVGGSLLSWLVLAEPYFICLPLIMKLMVLGVIFIGVWAGHILGQFKLNYSAQFLNYYYLSVFLSSMWNLTILSTLGVNYYPLVMSKIFTKLFDHGWNEYYGSRGLVHKLKFLTQFVQFFSTNHLKVFYMLTIIWLVLLLCC
uniref:NADH-ubiquinone oxidoreductase chain 5 n=1 Tax=Obrium sp. NS-2015 TaxID=1776756 RepID=A0A0U4B8Z4_9CUCU|nr:NADH dehydrogenase subunit 5 [Obrium sp. NS-2015]